jgi:hypothetical protein
MSRLIDFFARLYPRSWRERYGAEYAALLEEVRPDGRTAADVFIGAFAMQIRNWKSWGILAASTFFGGAVIAGLFVAMPTTYASKAVLKVGNQTGPLTHDAMDAVNTILMDVESRRRLTELVVADNLYQGERSRAPLEDLLDETVRHIRVTPVQAPYSAIAIEFRYGDRQMTQKVTQDLVARFMEGNLRQPNGLNLEVLDPASLPLSPIRPNRPLIIGWGVACFFAMWGVLSLMRRVRSHAPA